jgi:hypothetical protein
MKNLLFLFMTLLIISFSTSCRKDCIEDQMQEMLNCNASQKLDSLTLAGKLAGSWKLISFSCENNTELCYRDEVIGFTNAGKYSVTQNSVIVMQGSWGLHYEENDFFEVQTDGPYQYFPQRVLVCDNKILFNSSHLDGLDRLYKKISK